MLSFPLVFYNLVWRVISVRFNVALIAVIVSVCLCGVFQTLIPEHGITQFQCHTSLPPLQTGVVHRLPVSHFLSLRGSYTNAVGGGTLRIHQMTDLHIGALMTAERARDIMTSAVSESPQLVNPSSGNIHICNPCPCAWGCVGIVIKAGAVLV